MSTIDTTVLRLERTFAATPEQVWDAWTSPEVLRRWWRVDESYTVAEARVDARTGGGYRLAMSHDSGSEHVVTGEYLQVERPGLLVYTWAWEETDGSLGPRSTVSVRFEEQDGGTRVVVEHTGLPSEESRERHEAGWSGCLRMLKVEVLPGPGANTNEGSG